MGAHFAAGHPCLLRLDYRRALLRANMTQSINKNRAVA